MRSHKINNWEFKEHNSKMLKISFFGKLIDTQQKDHVDHKHVYAWNYTFLLHNYGNLYSYLHKYLFTYVFIFIIIMQHHFPTMDSMQSQIMLKHF
jgi:hypothetical protein